jgi:diaminohydroxyphosphoribosylaminopyrimidine deaminase/5-amino-6-(5-phosphoribosylamino)uracil reductase
MVGAVVVEGGKIVAEGFHARAGTPHAEVVALQALGRRPLAGATLTVTLEPCSTHGRTPPCVQAILDAGLQHVVVGTVDPNPLHAGKGIELLRAAGVNVTLAFGPIEMACRELNFLFNHWMVQRRALVAMKVARDATGRTVPVPGQRFITGELARADMMQWRRLFPVIAIGAGTALADNPQLTARLPEGVFAPVRLLLDRSGRTAGQGHLQILSDCYRSQTVVALDVRQTSPEQRAWFKGQGLQTLEISSGDFLKQVFQHATDSGWLGVFVEPGPALGDALLAARLINRAWIYTAPSGRADPASQPWLDKLSIVPGAAVVNLGEDTLISGSWK